MTDGYTYFFRPEHFATLKEAFSVFSGAVTDGIKAMSNLGPLQYQMYANNKLVFTTESIGSDHFHLMTGQALLKGIVAWPKNLFKVNGQPSNNYF